MLLIVCQDAIDDDGLGARAVKHKLGAPPEVLLTRIRRDLAQEAPHHASWNIRRVVPSEAFSVEDMWLREAIRRTADRVVSQLPSREAAVWDLARQGFPYTETAARLHIAENTVKVMAFRVRTKLRNAADLPLQFFLKFFSRL